MELVHIEMSNIEARFTFHLPRETRSFTTVTSHLTFLLITTHFALVKRKKSFFEPLKFRTIRINLLFTTMIYSIIPFSAEFLLFLCEVPYCGS